MLPIFFLENFDDESVRKSLFSKFSEINFLIPQKSSGEGSWKLKLKMNSNSDMGIPKKIIPDEIIGSWLGFEADFSEIKVKETEAFKNVEKGLAEILIFGQGGLKDTNFCHLGQLENIKDNIFLLQTVGNEDRDDILDAAGDRVKKLPLTTFCKNNERIMLTFPTLKADRVVKVHIQELGKRILTLIVKGK